MNKIIVALAIMISGVATFAQANGDAAAGQAKSAVCSACHGTDGNSQMNIYPTLAGQHAAYLEKQLHDFKLAGETGGKDGRNAAIMLPMVASLSQQDMADLAAYYASQTMSPNTTPEAVVARGEQLYRGGDQARGITACMACHGPRGVGTSLSGFPRISGQHAEYIKSQLELFRSGERANDLNGMMRDIAAKLTDEDIAVLSQYVGGLH